jgi:huntingtin
MIYVDNLERVKLLLHKIRHGMIFEANGVAAVLPAMLRDFFTEEQVMSLLLGEFVRAPRSNGRAHVLAQILFDYLRHKQPLSGTIATWILICLGNFTQMEPFDYSVWALTCVFLSASSNPLLKVQLYPTSSNSIVVLTICFPSLGSLL